MGLFKPVWMKANKPEKAIAAIEAMSDLSELKDVALHAPNSEVAKAACKRIDDDEALADIAMSTQSIRIAGFAVSRINDQSALKRIALEATSSDVRADALSKLRDQDAIMDLIRSGNARFLVLADRISDQENLREVMFDRLDVEGVAYDQQLSIREKEEVFKSIAAAVSKLRNRDDIDRAVSIFCDRCPGGSYVDPVRAVLEKKRLRTMLKQTSGQLVLVCKKCGNLVKYQEDYNTEDGSWAKDGWFSCGHGDVGGGPRRTNRQYDKPSPVSIEVRTERIDEKESVFLCPTCLKLKGNSPNSCMIPTCTCHEKSKLNVVVPFSPAEW